MTLKLRKEKQRYFNDQLRETKRDSRGTWRNLKQLLRNGSKSSGATARTANEAKNKCNIFNRFFVSCAEDLRSTYRSSARSIFKWLPQIDHPEKFKLRKITVSEVCKALKELKSKKATGVDGIPARLLKDGSDALASPLSVIFNLTIELNVIPAEWKKAKVTPLHKSGPKDDPRNYRPISVLPVVSKVLERLIHKQLAGYFDGHNLLCKSQSGFRRMHSTETAVTYFADEILMNMDKGLVTGSVFIDLAKAFDTVDHDIFLSKLEYYGVCDESLPWFKNYFTGRKQFVHIDSQSSEELAITSGVPQGSILGPLLFIVYINDLPRCVRHCSVNMYADDTVLYLAGPTVDNLIYYINEDLQCLSEWLENNNLVLNVSKTKCVLFTSQRHKERDCILNLNLLGKSISCETTFKYLGVVFDNFMTWKAHADYVCKKVTSRVGLLGRVRSFVTKEAATLVHNALILPLGSLSTRTFQGDAVVKSEKA